VIGQTGPFQIKVADTFSNPVAFGITVPADVTLAYLEPVQQGSGEPTTKYVTLQKGDANGEIALRLEFEP